MPRPDDYKCTIKYLSLKTIIEAHPDGLCAEFNKLFVQLCVEMFTWSNQNDAAAQSGRILRWACNHKSSKPLQWLIDKGFITNNAPELSPCPACGDKHPYVISEVNQPYPVFFVRCCSPHCCVRTETYTDKVKVIKAWNRRGKK